MVLKEFGYSDRLDRFETKGKGELVAKMQNFGAMLNSMVVCSFMLEYQRVRPSEFIELLNAVTGWSMDYEEFMESGERICNLTRMFNIRRGISRKDDTLPPRILTRKRSTGINPEYLPHLGMMLSEYYMCKGWTEEGIPTAEKLNELGLRECL
jgi:aldehyde:ferredoxin oxidoreductase